MKLSESAITDLRDAILNDMGPEVAHQFDDNALQHIGNFLLTVRATGLKVRAQMDASATMYKPD